MVNVHWISVWLSDYKLVRYSAAYRQRGVEAAKTRGRNLSKHPYPRFSLADRYMPIGVSGRAPQTSASVEHDFV